MRDTMLEAGWPAHMTEHAKAIAQARRLADTEMGWYHSPRYGSCGGPPCDDAIRDAVDLIARCAVQHVIAPWPTPFPDNDGRLELEWPNDWHICSLEWTRPGVWTAYLEGVPDTPEMDTATAIDAVRRELGGA